MESVVELKKDCCLCLKRFTDPRILPCLHTFCLRCLEKTGVMKPEQQMPCPACGAEFTVPLEGLSGLPRNLLAENLTYDFEKVFKTKALEKVLCNVCTAAQDKQAVLADDYCIVCEENLCLRCGEEHYKQREHSVVALRTPDQCKKRRTEGPECLIHQKELADLYCTYCKKVICKMCHEESHKSHNISSVADAAAFICKLAEKEYENISEMTLQFQQSSEKLQREKTKFLETVKKMETEILRRCEEIKEMVFTETKALLLELAVLRKERLEEIEMEQRRMEKRVFTLEKFKEYCAQIKNSAVASYTCESEGALRSTVGQLKRQQQVRIQSRILQLQISFQKGEDERFLIPLNNAVGQICVSCPHIATLSSPLDTDNKVLYGMANLQDKLYVLSDSILVYRTQKPFNKVGEIKTSEIKSPTDIVSCRKTPCLYIYDKMETCIWKITISDQTVRCWLDKINQPGTISVSSTGEVLVVQSNAGTRQPAVLHFYNEHGILTRQLDLPKTIQSLLCVYETQSESYIGLGEGHVYKFRADGSMIAEFQMSNEPKCSSPARCMELTPYRLFLAAGSTSNYYNSPVTSLLCLGLQWDDVLISGVSGERLCYVKESKQLAVLEANVINMYGISSQ